MKLKLAVWIVVLITVISLTACGGGGDTNLASLTVTPSAGTQSLGQLGQTVQFKATAIYTRSRSTGTVTKDVTSEVQWTSSNISVATIDATGLAKAVGCGASEIRATMAGGSMSAQSDVTVLESATNRDLVSTVVIPGGRPTVSNVRETVQFLTIGTFTQSPVTQDLTNQVTWISSDVRVATINSTGLATAVNSGQTTITSIATSPLGAHVTSTSQLEVDLSGGEGVRLPSVTVYAVGLGTGKVTSSPPGINCTSGAGCTANFPVGTAIELTAVPSDNSQLGGWSNNCILKMVDGHPDFRFCDYVVANNNDTFGVIFNLK